ncbi:MAG: hypothetical protein MUF02_04050 [Acidobacteria bacterium]|nr:hypothetical protein [Acidobacteriota bacterium]
MDARKFQEIEGLYKDLRERQAAGEVSAEEMKSELKKMMLRDEDNRYWMLGGKTGSWYVYDGSAWNAADPYEREAAATVARPEVEKPQTAAATTVAMPSKPAVPLAAARSVEESPETLCKFCHSRMDEHDAYCRFCGASPKAVDSKPSRPARHVFGDEIQVRSVRLLSLAIFCGGLGLVIGVVFGASFGIFKILGDLIYQFPLMLQDMRGKFLGGLFFGGLGGIAGFAAFALLGVLLGLFFNALCFIFTGPRFKVRL